MANQIRIFISSDAADGGTALDVQRQLALQAQPRETIFWNPTKIAPEALRTQATAFLEKADLFVAVLSMNYTDKPDVFWESTQAIAIQKDRPGLQIVRVQARESAVPAVLLPYPSALPIGETIENHGIPRDRQLHRAAQQMLSILSAAPASNKIPQAAVDLPLDMEGVRARLLAQTDRINHAPLLALLKRMIENVKVKRVILDVEDAFRHLREKTRLSQISISELAEQSRPIQIDLQHAIQYLREEDLVRNWRSVFIRDYFHFVSDSREESTVPPFFVPVDEIDIPETLNLPVGPREQESLEQIGLLSFEQKSDFRRSLLLAKDAMAVKNYTQAFAHCEHVRTKIDPQSAQLFEYLLITFLQKETPMRVMQEAMNGNDRPLQFVLMFASRLREYQRDGKCVSSTTFHNLAIASEALSDAALRVYHRFPNDPLLHTGKHEEDVPDNRVPLRVILDDTLKVCRLVYPSEELLEAAVIECCGGGKCAWVRRVDVVGEHFQFMPDGNFDLLGEIQELLDMLQGMEADDPGKIVKNRSLLREDLYFSLLAKRQTLAAQIAEDAKRRRPFTDIRASVIRFTYSCLLGAHIFGEDAEEHAGQSFLRLALEYLLPELILGADAQAPVQWFTLNESGELISDPECSKYQFDVYGIVQKIIRDYSGRAGWLQVAPNIKKSVYLAYVADTDRLYASVEKGLSFTDFRRMPDLDARRLLIECLRRWMVAYRAFPEQGKVFPENCIRELSGSGLMIWMHHNPNTPLVTHAESLGLGYDAQAELRQIIALFPHFPEDTLRETIALNLFQKRILPVYNSIKNRDEKQRPEVIRLLRETLAGYQLHPDLQYLDLVFTEITNEVKLPWIYISQEGKWLALPAAEAFNPIGILEQLYAARPRVFRLSNARERIAMRRYLDERERYFHDISEYRYENRRPERAIAVDIIRNMRGIYLFFPKDIFLEIPLMELSGKGRIRWHANFLGIFPIRENHYENHDLRFNYRYELFEVKRLLNNQLTLMQEMLRETGEI